MHEQIMRYYWNVYRGKDYYNVDVNALLNLFDTTTFTSIGGLSGGIVVKTDEANAAETLTREELETALRSWLSGTQLTNALRVLDTVVSCENTYHVNAAFTYAVMKQECSMGTANTTWVKENNWTSLTGLRTYQLSDSR